MKQKQLRVAIIGYGRSGRDIHQAHMSGDTDRFRIVAVADLLGCRRDMAKEECGCEVFESYRQLFGRKDIDLVVNASYSFTHPSITIDLLNNGFNVLCEKPFARTASEADEVIGAAGRSGKILLVYQQSRFAPYFQQIKKVIASEVLGRLVQVSIAFNGFARRWDWQTLQEMYGGNLLNTGPHPLDQALNLMSLGPDGGEKPGGVLDGMPEVFCAMDRANTYGDAEDYVKLILRAPGKPLVDLEVSSCCAYPSFTYNIQGTMGGLKGTMERVEWKYFLPDEAPEQHLTRIPLMNENCAPQYCSEKLQWHEEGWTVPDTSSQLFQAISASYYNMLYGVLAEGKQPEVTLDQVRLQIAVIEECNRQNPLSRLT